MTKPTATVLSAWEATLHSRAEAWSESTVRRCQAALSLFCFHLLLVQELKWSSFLEVKVKAFGISHGMHLKAWITRHNTCNHTNCGTETLQQRQQWTTDFAEVKWEKS